MTARKALALLVVAALSALTLFCVTLLDADAFGAEPAFPDTLEFYREDLAIGPDGDASVEVSVVLGAGSFRDLLLPFPFADAHDFTILSGPVAFGTDSVGAARPLVHRLGRGALNLRLAPGAAPGDSIAVRARLAGWRDGAVVARPFGESAVARSFVNSSDFHLREFVLGLRLPPGNRVHAVDAVRPAYDPKRSPAPPYTIGSVAGAGTFALRATDLGPATEAGFRLRYRPARRGPLVLVAGSLLGLLYLVRFRDILKPGEGS